MRGGPANRQQRLADIAAIAACAAAVISAGAVAWRVLPAELARHAEAQSNCEPGRAALSTTILIDATDPFAPNEQDAIRDSVGALASELAVGDLLSVYEIDGRTNLGLSRPAFQRCKPRTGQDADSITENATLMAESYRRGFLSPLSAATDAIVNRERSDDTSPILEAIADFAQKRSATPDRAPGVLVIYSDFLQRSPALDQYAAAVPYARFAAGERAGIAASDLTNVDVRLFQIIRDETKGGGRQTGAQEEFWRAYFEASGAATVAFVKIR